MGVRGLLYLYSALERVMLAPVAGSTTSFDRIASSEWLSSLVLKFGCPRSSRSSVCTLLDFHSTESGEVFCGSGTVRLSRRMWAPGQISIGTLHLCCSTEYMLNM